MQGSTLVIRNNEQFTASNVNANHQGVLGTAAPGVATNIDYVLVDDCFVTGAILFAKGAAWGDTLTLQVVDVSNMYGRGAGFVLGQYVTNWALRTDSELQFDQNSTFPAKVITGLALRVVYSSTGAVAVPLAVNYKLQKALF